MDENKRIFGVVHWVDLLVIIASLLVMGRVVVSFWPADSFRNATSIRISLVSSNLRPQVLEGIRPGQWVKDSRTGVVLGIIKEKRAVPHAALSRDSGPGKTPEDERLDLQLVLEQKAVIKENEGTFIGPLTLRVGRKGSFFTADAEFYGEVIKVEKTQLDPQE